MLTCLKRLPLILGIASSVGCKGSFVITSEVRESEHVGAGPDGTSTTITTSTSVNNTDPTAAPSTTPASLNITIPENFNDGDRGNSTTDSPTLSWDQVDDTASYEIAVGTSQGATDILAWTDVGAVTSITIGGLTLPNVSILYASVRAVGSDGSKGLASSGDGWQNLVCPSNWVKVPGSTTPGLGGNVYINGTRTRHDGSTRELSDFCVMKYEAKIELSGVLQPKGDADNDEVDLSNAGDVAAAMPVSRPDGRPMVRVERTADDDLIGAIGLCNKINGTGLVSASVDSHFYLMNNAQWQAIARNIESDSRNTSGGVYNRGHTDGSASLAASSDDAEGCSGYVAADTHNVTAVSATCDDTWHLNKRTHTMTNDEVIWDIAGNAWEWVIDDVGVAQHIDPSPDLSTKGVLEYTDATCGGGADPCFSSANRLTFGPDNSALTSSDGIGRFYGGFGSYGGTTVRGGFWNNGTVAGVFYASLGSGSSLSDNAIGARCVWAP